MKQRLSAPATLVLAIGLLAGCGGGGGGDTKTATSNAESLPGLYSGPIDFQEDGVVDSEGLFLVAPNRSVIIIADEAEYNRGSLTFDSTSFTGSLGLENSALPPVSLSGFRNADNLVGQAVREGVRVYAFSFQRQHGVSDTPAELAAVEGSWFETHDGVSTTIVIGPDGKLSGTGFGDCIFDGTLRIPDARYNIYSVTATADNCSSTVKWLGTERDGSYTGLATVEPASGGLPRRLVLAMDNGQVPVLFLLDALDSL